MPQKRKGARLYLRNVKGYEPVYVILDGAKQYRTGCGADQLREAEKALAKYINENHRPDTQQRSLSEIRCADVINLYTSEAAPSKPSAATIGYHGTNLLQFWGEKNLSDVKRSSCKKYVEFRCKKALPTKKGQPQRFVGAATARQELKTFGAAINYWHGESPLEAVPRVSLPDVVSKRERVLERDEVAKMLRAAKSLKYTHIIRFILIGLYTGTRHEAILRLRWSPALSGGHVDLERNTIYRRGSSEQETSKRRTPVRISKRLSSLLSNWKLRDGGILYVVHYHGERIQKLRRSWASVVKKAGLGPEVTPHVLRHTCCSWLLWQGWTIWDVAGFVGADASTIERTYGHHKPLAQEERKRA
jgi:integrase